MRLPVATLALWFAALQLVSFTDCCCGSFCKHKGSCTGCEEQEKCSTTKPAADDKECWNDRETPARPSDEHHPQKKRCTHVEPPSDVVAGASLALDVVPNHEEAVSLPPCQAFDLEPFGPSRAPDKIPRSTPDRPIHLLNSALLL